MFVAFFQFAAALIALRRVARSVAGETARVVVMGALVGVGLTTITVAQQVPHETYGQSVTRSVAERKAPKVLEVVNVRQNLYVAYGGGGNSAIFVTDLGVVLVDTSWAGWGQVILDQIKKITDKPVTTIINTHAHGDHSDGNTEFAFNVEFIAHENTRTNMERGDTTQAPMPDFSGEKAAFLPKRTFKDRLSLFSGKDRMDLHYFGAGHTNGDIAIEWPTLGVVQVGDLFPAKRLPLVDVPNGGSGVAFPETLSRLTTTLENIDLVIQGHSPVARWDDLLEYTAFWQAYYAHVSAAYEAGQSVDSAADTWNTPARFAGYEILRFKENAQKIYDELNRPR